MPQNSIGLEKVDLWPVKDVQQVADKHVTKIRKRVEDRGKDFQGRQFKPYSRKYRELKARDFRKLDGGRYKGYEELATVTSTSPPNLRLTGRMLRDLRRRSATKDKYSIGWRGEPAEKVKWNKEMGRDIISGVPDDELDWIANQLGMEADREFRRKLKKHVRIKIS